MKVIIHTRLDGGVTRYDIMQTTDFAILTGAGYGWPDERVAWEILKFTEGGLSEVAAHSWILGLSNGGLTEDEAVECFRLRLEHKPKVADVVLDDGVLPPWMRGTATAEERYDNFREVAEWDGTTCHCNMPKARLLHMQRIRGARNTELVNLDVPFIRAVEVKNAVEQERIAGLKQVLRDIPQTFSLSTYQSASTLNAAWPVELPSRDA
jgi:hypothetical protein